MQSPASPPRRARALLRGFTLIELLVSMAVLSVLFVLVTQVVSSVQLGWRQTTSAVSQFREARRAFDRIVNTVSQAELNNYLCYRYPNSLDPLSPPASPVNPTTGAPTNSTIGKQPNGYVRYSELQFVCGPSSSKSNPQLTGLDSSISPGDAIFFQAPLGTTNVRRLPTALNGSGFYLKFGDDADTRPPFLASTTTPVLYRYRLYEYRSPTENNRGYDTTPPTTSGPATNTDPWYSDYASYSQPIANNIILLLFSPMEATTDSTSGRSPTEIAPQYVYNSTPPGGIGSGAQGPNDYQLPPLVGVTMVAIDETSAENLAIAQSGMRDTDRGSKPPLTSQLSGLFTNAANLQSDLDTLSNQLVLAKVNFRIFTATVPIRASKWGKGAQK